MAPEHCAPAEPRLTGRRTNAFRVAGGLVARERLERHGADALGDEELLAILVDANGAHTTGALLEACGELRRQPRRAASASSASRRNAACSAPGSGRWTRASSISGRVFRPAATRRARRHRALPRPPLGDPTPSVDDVVLTERLQQAGTLMGIEVLDPVILADTRYCSFKAMGRL